MFMCLLFDYNFYVVFLCPLSIQGTEWSVIKDFGSSLRQITELERWDKKLLSRQARGWMKAVIRHGSLQYIKIMSASGQKTKGWTWVRIEYFLLPALCKGCMAPALSLLAVLPRCLWGIPRQMGFSFFFSCFCQYWRLCPFFMARLLLLEGVSTYWFLTWCQSYKAVLNKDLWFSHLMKYFVLLCLGWYFFMTDKTRISL